MGDDKNFLIAIVLSVLVFVAWQYFFGMPAVEDSQARREGAPAQSVPSPAVPTSRTPEVGTAPGVQDGRPVGPVVGPLAPQTSAAREDVLKQSVRIDVDSPRLKGSISLKGLRIDDIELKDYREDIDPDSPQIVLLKPPPVEGAYYVSFGWLSDDRAVPLPDENTIWQPRRPGPLTPETPIEFTWDNGQGLTFVRRIALDADYVFTITQRVENKGGQTVRLFPFAKIVRYGEPETQGFFILHEGPLGVFNGTLEELKYKELRDKRDIKFASTGGWLGITDKYWLTALLPDQSRPFQATFSANGPRETEYFQADYYLTTPFILSSGQSVETTNRLFSGAKKVGLINRYQKGLGIERFDLAIDWGWLFFLTKPFFQALHLVGNWVGNFGVAILIITVLIKLVFFPLANKSYVAMSKMKKLQPEMTRIRERFADDKVRQQQEMMELYKREKVNPMAGCLPIIIQIPVFFALYKVLFVTIEMRQAPFFGWIKDLSAPDPTTIFNLFGLIPWDPPTALMIGAWPLIMGITMFVQQKLNPAPADPVQEKIFLFMPIFFTYLLARFPAGLVIYWAWNNALSILQQYVIMRRMGVEVKLLDRLIPEKLLVALGKGGRSPGKGDSSDP